MYADVNVPRDALYSVQLEASFGAATHDAGAQLTVTPVPSVEDDVSVEVSEWVG